MEVRGTVPAASSFTPWGPLRQGSVASVLEEVSTVRGSGWVDDEHGILRLILNPQPDPPATAGGTDCVQPKLHVFVEENFHAAACSISCASSCNAPRTALSVNVG